jgi:hypothetical protein
MVSTWARTVRVVNIQPSEATTSAMTRVVIRSILPAMITRMAMAGTVSSAVRDHPDHRIDNAAELPGDQPEHRAEADADEAGDQPHLERVGRRVDQQRPHVAALRVGAQEVVGPRRLARSHRADLARSASVKNGPISPNSTMASRMPEPDQQQPAKSGPARSCA